MSISLSVFGASGVRLLTVTTSDPLRWPRWKKNVCFGSVCAFTFLTNYAIGGLSPAFYLLSVEFEKTQAQITGLLLWPILVLGIFNFFWVPMANYFVRTLALQHHLRSQRMWPRSDNCKRNSNSRRTYSLGISITLMSCCCSLSVMRYLIAFVAYVTSSLRVAEQEFVIRLCLYLSA